MKNNIITNIPNYDGIGIYSLINNTTGKIYVGSSINIKTRILQHLYSFKTLKCSQCFIADLKSGHTFSVQILQKFPYGISEYTLREKENEYIKQVWKDAYNYGPANYVDPRLKKRIISAPIDTSKSKLKRIPLDVQKEKYEEIKAAADAAGEKVNGYIKKAIDERMKREK
mgnify:CR=1 FL=1